MEPESVEIKANAVESGVADAIDTLGLTDGKTWAIHFCEDVTLGVTPATPLLDVGVVLRARSKGKQKGDCTVKLRPCRWSQLDGHYFQNWEQGDQEFKVEADWGARGRGLAASLTAQWDDDRLEAALNGDTPTTGLFTADQRWFLRDCARASVNVDAVTVLPGIEATRWDPVETTVGATTLSIRPERWTVAGLFDYLEFSIVSTVASAPVDQEALDVFLSMHSIPRETDAGNKTERALRHLVGRVSNLE